MASGIRFQIPKRKNMTPESSSVSNNQTFGPKAVGRIRPMMQVPAMQNHQMGKVPNPTSASNDGDRNNPGENNSSMM